MSKLDAFKLRATQHGQSVTIYPFSANPSGNYVDPNSGYPDPEDPDYPGTVPGTTYGTAVAALGFVQPGRVGNQTGGQRYVKTAAGEDVPVDLVVYLAGDQAVTVRDKLVIDGVNYEVLQIQDFKDSATVVVREVALKRMVP
jgi:hypothetical protein